MLSILKKYRFIIAIILAAILIYGVEQYKKPDIEIKIIAKAPTELVELISASEPIYIVNFFATWCGPCRKEHHFLVKLYASSPFPIYGIALSDNSYQLEQFLKKNGNPFKKVISDFNSSALQGLKINTIPRTIIIASGNIIYDHTGPISKEHLFHQILPLLERLYNF